MATSGSINFSINRNEIITEALELLGAISFGETPSANEITSCARTLNLMIKAWNGQGIHLWTETEMEQALVVDTNSYTLSPRPLHIKQVRFRNSDNIDWPIRIDGRSDFMQITNKTTPGKISRVYYDPQLGTNNKLYVWPTPDDATDTLQITYIRSLEDFDASSDDADFPSEWLEAISTNLAIRIAPKYGKVLSKVNPDLISLAQQSLIEMQLWDTESAKIRIVPETNYDD